jgi:hypothetical protein
LIEALPAFVKVYDWLEGLNGPPAVPEEDSPPEGDTDSAPVATLLIVRENDFVDEALFPPVTRTVKVEVPAVVGVPLIAPPVDRESPAGRDPEETDQLYGCVPPVAASVLLYAVPTVPAVSGLAVEIVGAAAALIVKENDFVDEALFPPVTRTVKVEVPAVVGVPLIAPPVDRERPAGRDPEETDQLYGVVPPLADNVWLYAVPTVPAGSGLAVEIVGACGAETVKGFELTLTSPWVEPLSLAFPNQAAW